MKIFIERLVLKGKHGVSDREREVAQEFQIDISAEADTRASAESDEISDTVNYKDFAEIAREVIEGPSSHLIETLAHRIAKRILEDERIKAVSVTVRKPQVLPSGVPGVTMVRGQ